MKVLRAIVCNFPQSGGVMRRFDPIQIESCSEPDGLVLSQEFEILSVKP